MVAGVAGRSGRRHEKIPPRKCLACGKILKRKKRPGGYLERAGEIRKRKYCGRVCAARALDAKG